MTLGPYSRSCRTAFIRSGIAGGLAGELRFGLQAVDVSNAAQVTKWARALIDRGCIPDILICNAAVINEPAPTWRVRGSEFHDVIATNVLGTGYTLQAFLPSMIRRGTGLIIVVSSVGRS